jgi:argininosuccinate lyase
MSSIARTAATGGGLDPEFLRWSTSLPVDQRLLEADCRGSEAHVEGLRVAGLLNAEEAKQLTAALRALPHRIARGEIELPAEEDVHMAIEAVLRAEIGPVADKLHTGRSRNDQVATDFKLWCKDAVENIADAIENVANAADRWSQRFGNTVVPSYTHRQVAIPVLGDIWIEGALVAGLRRDYALLDAVRGELQESPLGAGAIAGTTLPIDKEANALRLGFARGPSNPIDAVGTRDYASLLVFACARIGQHLGRFCADVVELAADGLVKIGGPVAGGSSMMPHKRNPDLFELVRGEAALRLGDLASFMALFHGLGAGYHRDLQHDKNIVFRAVDGLHGCLRMIALGIDHLEPVQDACIEVLARGDAIATDLCELLVAHGKAFRDAYRTVGALVVRQRERGKRLVDLSAEELAGLGLPEEALDCLDIVAAAHRRSGRGNEEA